MESKRTMVRKLGSKTKCEAPASQGGTVNTWNLSYTVGDDNTVKQMTVTLDAGNLGLLVGAVTVVALELVG